MSEDISYRLMENFGAWLIFPMWTRTKPKLNFLALCVCYQGSNTGPLTLEQGSFTEPHSSPLLFLTPK